MIYFPDAVGVGVVGAGFNVLAGDAEAGGAMLGAFNDLAWIGGWPCGSP